MQPKEKKKQGNPAISDSMVGAGGRTWCYLRCSRQSNSAQSHFYVKCKSQTDFQWLLETGRSKK
jgi:hypothetical protein